MRESKRNRKRRHLASRTALSQRNITEHAIVESKKAVHRNKSAQSHCLRTHPALLTVVYIAPPKEQGQANSYDKQD
jgi:hypothetical protein